MRSHPAGADDPYKSCLKRDRGQPHIATMLPSPSPGAVALITTHCRGSRRERSPIIDSPLMDLFTDGCEAAEARWIASDEQPPDATALLDERSPPMATGWFVDDTANARLAGTRHPLTLPEVHSGDDDDEDTPNNVLLTTSSAATATLPHQLANLGQHHLHNEAVAAYTLDLPYHHSSCINDATSESGSSALSQAGSDSLPRSTSPSQDRLRSRATTACSVLLSVAYAETKSRSLICMDNKHSAHNQLRVPTADNYAPPPLGKDIKEITPPHSPSLSLLPTRGASSTDLSSDGSNQPLLMCPSPGCRAQFRKRNSLSSHMVIHSAQRENGCNLCGMRFKRKHDLVRHIKTLHDTSRPYQCLTCNQRFSKSSHLMRHALHESHEVNPERMLADVGAPGRDVEVQGLVGA